MTLTAQAAAGFVLQSLELSPTPAGASCSGAACSYTPVTGQAVTATATFTPSVVPTRHFDVFGSVLFSGGGTVTSDVGGIDCTFGGSSVGTGTCEAYVRSARW